MRAPRLIDPVIDTGVADALAAAIVEPAVATGAHTLAGLLTFVPRVAMGHVGHRAVDRHHVGLHTGLVLLAVARF